MEKKDHLGFGKRGGKSGRKAKDQRKIRRAFEHGDGQGGKNKSVHEKAGFGLA